MQAYLSLILAKYRNERTMGVIRDKCVQYNNFIKLIHFFLLLTFSLSCTDSSNTLTCTQLARNIYKGLPFAHNKVQSKCPDFPYKKIVEDCKHAFLMLVKTGDKKKLIRTYDKNIFQCFTNRDMKSYLKSSNNEL